ncbi:unnamed protein product [Coffea canephora]|uniref:TOD1/MUCI70 glycosyltransferase-like domain-containing protein n=2 Tax=Coffea TaxID=13442 RepID=A0A068UBQ3_COFCA|nr:uncharacterized protein LOC113690994 isoform X1 [Coffea arabica]CDP05921.1 unnamed protein product [Coffea canephora]
MNEVSSGLRSLSFGSLQLHSQNGGLQSQNSSTLRKTSRTLSGSREKERYLPFIFKYLGRRKVIMLILVIIAILALTTGFLTASKEAASESSMLGFDGWFENRTYPVSREVEGTSENGSNVNIHGVCSTNNGSYLPTAHNSTATIAMPAPVMLSHPCKTFAFPPPPPGDARRIGPRPCPVCYIPVEQAIAALPRSASASPVLHHLTYFYEENPMKTEPHGGSDFGGYPSLKQRNDYFNVNKSMTVHCGFIKGCRAGDNTGFDIDLDDLKEMDEFHEIIVASAIFGNYDIIQQPTDISEIAKKNIPFYMFVDEETEAYMKNSSLLDNSKRVGLWRIIVVHNVPYTDPRRNGKVPKLLLHRLFPNVRYSIWIDGKLQLVVDPYQILERFLWRQNATFAISRHYARFDVIVEAEANKAAGKYDNVSIDNQIDFYRKEGLTPYSKAKLPITSDVPEGCVIIREHIPITNLFTCLWFNEVDRFTSRDQLSFSTVRDKIMAKANWTINMFLDCERRNFVIQAYHRDLLERRPPPLPRARVYSPPSSVRYNTPTETARKKSPVKRVRGGKKPGSRRHRKVVAGNRDNPLLRLLSP